MEQTLPKEDEMPTSMGGRRHRGSKKAHKGKRHGNASLRAWVTFVKKVQKEEGIGYKEAMSVAKKRKDGGEKWRGGGGLDEEDTGMEPGMEPGMGPMAGGRSRSRSSSRGRSSRRGRSQRRSRSSSRGRSQRRGRSSRRSRR